MNENFSVKENSWMAGIAAKKLGVPAVAMTIGSTIYLHHTRKEEFLSNERWVRHELAHVAQFRKYGTWKFLFLYLVESLQNGYYDNKYEQEAREAEVRNTSDRSEMEC